MNYKRWKELIPKNPTIEDFKNSWKIVFGYYPNECDLKSIDISESNIGFTITTPTGTIMHGGFGFHTDEPKLKSWDELYYEGGITWSRDKEGDRYYFVSKETQLPADWNKVKSIETIKEFMRNNNKLKELQ